MVQIKTLLLPVLSLVGSALASSSAVKALTPSDFDSTVFAGTPSLVEFFAPWCGHCKKLAPIYDELASSLSHSKDVNIASVDGDAHKELSVKYDIQGFPTIKWFDGVNTEPTDYQGGRDLESLQAFISEKTGKAPKKKVTPPSFIKHLTDRTFSGAIGGDKDVLVAFTAPWCGHCKTLAPIWEQLATDFEPETSVTVAKVNAEDYRELAQTYGVSGYPTIKFFPAGSKTPVDYNSGRDEASLVEYLNSKAGTHRSVGGGLSATGGTIAALDSIVGKLTGANMESIAEEIKAAIVDTKDKYAEYYVKALSKISANSGYMEKEVTRLQNILAKGGLARSKQDDLTSRLNILKKFALHAVGREEL